jgi:adenine deaminase
MVFDDLRSPTARRVFVAGKLVNGYHPAPLPAPWTVTNTTRVLWDRVDLDIPARGTRIRVIGSLPDQLVTEHRILDATVREHLAVADSKRDLLKMAVIERHRSTGNVGLGFIQGFGLQRGAIAGTVAHDHHNLVVIGADDVSMMTAARAAADDGGGLAVAAGSTVLATLPLPVAGLMSDKPIAEVRTAYDALLAGAAQLGSSLHDPFMAMSFMALEVIPALKLTDQGLVNVEKFEKVDLFV